VSKDALVDRQGHDRGRGSMGTHSIACLSAQNKHAESPTQCPLSGAMGKRGRVRAQRRLSLLYEDRAGLPSRK
jgi:hypothetical protein